MRELNWKWDTQEIESKRESSQKNALQLFLERLQVFTSSLIRKLGFALLLRNFSYGFKALFYNAISSHHAPYACDFCGQDATSGASGTINLNVSTHVHIVFTCIHIQRIFFSLRGHEAQSNLAKSPHGDRHRCCHKCCERVLGDAASRGWSVTVAVIQQNLWFGENVMGLRKKMRAGSRKQGDAMQMVDVGYSSALSSFLRKDDQRLKYLYFRLIRLRLLFLSVL